MRENRGIWHAKCIDNGEWVKGVYNCITNSITTFETLSTGTIVETGIFDVDPSTLGECACVPDMNGKPIFEGDICTVVTPNIADDEYGVVKYDEDEAVFIIDFGTYTINFCNNVDGSSVEVIGNIHDNPEFISKGAAE